MTTPLIKIEATQIKDMTNKKHLINGIKAIKQPK
jgi:hypothetical protein